MTPKIKLYLVSYFEDRSFIEASLGGKVTPAEVEVFGEELVEMISSLNGKPYQLLLDYSRARGMSHESHFTLGIVRDKCHELGAQKIVSVTSSESERERETSYRLEAILEGREDYVLDPAFARFPVLQEEATYLFRAA